MDSNQPDEISFQRKLLGLLFFRLLLAVFFLLLTLILQSRREGDLLSVQLQPLYFFSSILFVFTIIGAVTLKYVHNLKRFAYLQLSFDVGAVTVLIFISGGVESLFSFLYMPVIISAAVLLYRRGSLYIASMSSLAYGALLDTQYLGWISTPQIFSEGSFIPDSGIYFHTLVMNLASFFLVGWLGGYLAEEVQKSSLKVRQHKQDFQKLERLHLNTVQSINSGLLTISHDGIILFCNNAAIEILGQPAGNIEGAPLRNIVPSLDPTSWEERPRIAPTGGSPLRPPVAERMELTYTNPAGESLYLGYTVSLLDTGGGEPSGWIVILQDLTRMRAMEENVKRMERLVFAGRIAAEIAHEIKNPLAAMSGAIQMLEDEVGQNALQLKLMGIVGREIHRINELVNDFLWLSRGAQRKGDLEEAALLPIIQEILSLLRMKNRISPMHRLLTEFDGAPRCLVDPHHFRQILWNLLVNALESMPEGGEVMVRVREIVLSSGGESEVRIDVEDTGCGIREDLLDRIFEPFFTTKDTGTGLGLSIVYQLVQNLNGRLEVSRGRDCGSTFSLFFPALRAFPLANSGVSD